MNTPINLSDLDVVAYGTALSDTMLPAVVPPVFRSRGDAGAYFVPPFTIDDYWLYGATQIVEAEYRSLCEEDRLTPIEQPMAARAHSEMWVDQQRHVHYELQEVATRHMQEISAAAVSEAVTALQCGALNAADIHCGVAISDDCLALEPFAIKAAISRLQNDVWGERVVCHLAKTLLHTTAFDGLVEKYASMVPRKVSGAS